MNKVRGEGIVGRKLRNVVFAASDDSFNHSAILLFLLENLLEQELDANLFGIASTNPTNYWTYHIIGTFTAKSSSEEIVDCFILELSFLLFFEQIFQTCHKKRL